VPEPDDPAELVTLVRVADLTTAQLLCGRLDADGIHCEIPDEHMANPLWHLRGPTRGLRVQVRRGDLEQAQQILAEQPLPDDEPISDGDRAAFRSLRVALVTLLLMGLLHPYSLWLAVRALRRPDITAWGKRRAGIALVVSLAGCLWAVLLVYRLLQLRA
jgi:hypothetical protein